MPTAIVVSSYFCFVGSVCILLMIISVRTDVQPELSPIAARKTKNQRRRQMATPVERSATHTDLPCVTPPEECADALHICSFPEHLY